MEWKLTFLGTGAANPTPQRAASCAALQICGDLWLFDCGEGSQMQLMKSTLRLGKINKIFITHLHGDHLFGLPGLMCTISQNSAENRPPLLVYGPPGIAGYIRQSLSVAYSILGYKYEVIELVDNKQDDSSIIEIDPQSDFRPQKITAQPHMEEASYKQISRNNEGFWDLGEHEGVRIRAAELKHRVPCVGYVLEEGELPGKLDAMKLKSLGVLPGPLYAKIKSGETIIGSEGVEIKPSDVIGESRPGRKIAILGDTCDCSQLFKIGQNLDFLVHEATNGEEDMDKAIQNGHSTAKMATECAKAMKADTLILTHVSQRYKPRGEELKGDDESVEVLLKQAKEEFNKVYLAEDLATFVIPVKKN